jgi:hypothetical protein
MSIESKELIPVETQEHIVAALAGDGDLQAQVRSIVMRAIAERNLDAKEVKQVIRAVFSGMGQGLPQRGQQAADAARAAVQGLDEAVGKSVYALRMAAEEAWDQGRQYGAGDVKEAVEDIRELEADLLSTLKDHADRGQGVVKEVFTGLHAHLARTGTDTGNQVRDVLARLGSQMADAAQGSGSALKAQAETGKTRLKAVAAGILRGLADGLERRP